MNGNSKGKVLITEVVHPVLQTELSNFGFECLHLEKTTYTDVLQIIDQYCGLVVRSKIKVDRQLIDKGKQLRFIGRTGSGMELIDVEYATQKGISCLNSPEGNCNSVAEHATAMLLCLLHNVVKADAELRHCQWKRAENTGFELMGKTVGIIGYGNTGSAFARRLKAFGVKILAYDKYKSGFGGRGITETTLNTIFEQADVVSLHVPLTPQTRHWVNSYFIAQFQKPVYLINTSRGEVLNTPHVIQALYGGKLKGVALDVFENEDLAAYTATEHKWLEQLCRHPQTVITPHIAGVTHEATYKMAAILAKKIIHHATSSL